MSCASRTEGFVLPLATQRAMRFWRGSGIRPGGEGAPKDLRPISLSLGDPAFVTPENVRQRAKEAIDEGHTHYERNADLKEAIARKLAEENGVDVGDPQRGIVVTPGAHAALYQVMKAYVASGDEVIMGDPGSYYYSNTTVNGGTVVLVPLRPERGFRLDPGEVAARITPRTKMICLTSPDAPVGAVQREDDLREIARLAHQHDLLVVSDELYEYINFGDAPHVSIAALPGMTARTITINGFSKGWAMTGWRIGYAAGVAELMAPVAAINHLNLISVNSISQWAALETLEGPQEFLARAVEVYRERLDLLLERLEDIDGIKPYPPEGSYYCWTDISAVVDDASAFSKYAWRSQALRLLPGQDFGPSGRGYLRLSCSPTPDDIVEGTRRLALALKDYHVRG
ncbi:MAG: pyridoxal phosphate-dependent aminotransferase [Clostridia bacterium]